MCLLKRHCLITYRHSECLSFQGQVYCIGGGLESVEESRVIYPKEYLEPTSGTLDIIRWSLASIFLRCGQLKDRFGEIIVRHLSSIQAKILLEKTSKITVVEGKAGSGKSILALETMRRIKQSNTNQSKMIFLCRGGGLAAFIKYQTETMGICVDIQTLKLETREQMNEEYFSQYTDIIIDDAHSLQLTGHPNWRGMYYCLFSSLRKPNSRAFIFLDPDMQDYRGCIPTDFSKEIQNMARNYHFIRRQDVKTETLGKILRNSTRICYFIGVNMGHEMDELRNIRNLPEDGVYLYVIKGLAKTMELLCHTDNGGEEVDEKDSAEGGVADKANNVKDKHYEQNEANDVEEGDDNAGENEEDGSKKGDLDAAAIKVLKKLKLLLQAVLKGTVYEEHGHNGGDTSGEKESVENVEEDDDDKFEVDRSDKTEGLTLVSRIRSILSSTLYQERDVTILTENDHEKQSIQEMLRCLKYPTQDATVFPVEHMVVDTLETFEGLESPVILFIVPESWGTGSYIGSLKYRLCITTRAISRVEFLIPWDQTDREQDLAELRRAFQTKVITMVNECDDTRCYYRGIIVVTP